MPRGAGPRVWHNAAVFDAGDLKPQLSSAVVDNGGAHSSITRDGHIPLERGPHQVVLLYSQLGGSSELEWRWARDRDPLVTVPDWLLSPRPWRFPALVAARWLEWIWRALAVAMTLLAAPMLWLGASPVLAYNVVLLAGFALTGWAMCLVVQRWTDDWTAGIAAGFMMAFNAHTLTRLPHLQAQHVEFLPLALLSLDRVLRQPRWKSALWLGVSVALQALASVYLLVFSALAITIAVLARPEDWLGERFTAVVPKLALSSAVAGVALVPFLLPYWRLHDQGFVRSLDEVAYFAASARDYLTTTSRFHTDAGGRFALFPGTIALTLAAVSILSRTAFTDARARMCLAFGLCGVVLSFGPAVAPGYELLYSTLPILGGIRTASRFGYLGLVAVAVVGGYGVAVLRQRLARHTAWRRTISLAVLALVFLEPLVAPIDLVPFHEVPPIYALPATEPNAIIVELPLPPPELQFRNAPYLLNSTANWRRLLNGYSGFIPATYFQHFAAMKTFPRRESIRAMVAAGVTNMFVHLDQLGPGDVEAIEHEPALRRLALDGPVAFYGIDPERTR